METRKRPDVSLRPASDLSGSQRAALEAMYMRIVRSTDPSAGKERCDFIWKVLIRIWKRK